MNKIEEFIVNNIDNHSRDIAKLTALRFNISVQAVNKHLKKLIVNNVVATQGNTRAREYFLVQEIKVFDYKIDRKLSESVIWTRDIKELMPIKQNVNNVWAYGFMEMFNNAIEHSSGKNIRVVVFVSAIKTRMLILDDGIGIFKNIQNKFNLLNEHEAILELSKGKLTTDKAHHSGEGVFFTSRAFDKFAIDSHGIMFTHNKDRRDFLFDDTEKSSNYGTAVLMEIANDSNRILKDVFKEFAGEDYGFDKTIIPIELAKYGDENLVSRSQARRVLNRITLFKNVIFDFDNVPQIGQAFADEIFRVFAKMNPSVQLEYINANEDVESMINRAKNSNIDDA